MTAERTHRAISDDGTEIVGTVHGSGPSLVLQHGALDDGTVTWGSAVRYLADRFTCHVPSLRNRGRSGRSEDSTPPRLVEDVTAYAASLGEPVSLVGLSLGGALVLGVAPRLEEVTAVVAFEPALTQLLNEQDRETFLVTVMREAEAAEQGRLADAGREFARLVGNPQEVATLDAAGAFETMAPSVAADLALIQQGAAYDGTKLGDPEVLAGLTAPLLLLQGRRTNVASWFHAAVRHVAEHVPQAEVRELEDHGHLAPMVDPEPVVAEVVRFLDQVSVSA